MKYHVLPTNDLKEHNTSETMSKWCDCKPVVEVINKVVLVIHNSFDGRENIEKEITKYVNKIKRKTK